MKHSSKAAALAAILVAAGCGGSGSLKAPSGATNFTGPATESATLSSPAVVPASGGTTVATSNGSAVIPSGVTPGAYPTDTPLAIIPAGTGFKLNSAPSSDLIVNGNTDSGIPLGSTGLTTVDVALPISTTGTTYTLAYNGAELDTRALNVQTISFSGAFYLRSSAPFVISPIPVDIKGSIPNNGENAAGSFMNVTWGPGNTGRSATLDIVYGNGFSLHQTTTIDGNNYASFKDLFKDASNVPNSGVQSVSFTIGPK